MERERQSIDHTQLLAAYRQAVEHFRERPGTERWQRVEDNAAVLYAALLLPGKVDLGRLVATPGALTALGEADHIPPEFLLRHKHGDWGEVPPEDAAANERALAHGARLLSAYRTRLDQPVWVITESDRSATTLLLPDEY